MDLSDKVVLITGASSGIGAATALHFAKYSAKLALVGRNENNLKRIALYCEKTKGVKPLQIVADVTEDAERIISEATDHFGRLDVLINNAGVICMGGLKKNPSMESYDKVMSTNVRAVYHLTMVATPYLISSKGCVVNVSSIAGSKPNSLALAYNMSKAAINHFTKCAALELASDGVRVNSVSPGFVKTNLWKDIGLTEDQQDLFVKNVVSGLPMKKIVEGDQVAALIAFLASDVSSSITGCNYVIDGGSSLQ